MAYIPFVGSKLYMLNFATETGFYRKAYLMIASKAYTCRRMLLNHTSSNSGYEDIHTLEQHPPKINTVITPVANKVEPLSTAKRRRTFAKVRDGGPLLDVA